MKRDPAHHQSRLRAEMRQSRERLHGEDRRRAAMGVAELALGWERFQRARAIAGYHAMGGEIDPEPVLQAALDHGKKVFLPVLEQASPPLLCFGAWRRGTAMQNNRFNIPEPRDTERVSADELDLVLAPLVACDRRGNRIGMGGGFYDTTFHHRLNAPGAAPVLVGVAYDIQVLDTIEPNPWDVPMDYLLTEKEIIDCRRARRSKA